MVGKNRAKLSMEFSQKIIFNIFPTVNEEITY